MASGLYPASLAMVEEERPEAVHGGSRVVTDAIEGIEHGVLGKRLVGLVDAGEDKALVAVQYAHAVQDGQGPGWIRARYAVSASSYDLPGLTKAFYPSRFLPRWHRVLRRIGRRSGW